MEGMPMEPGPGRGAWEPPRRPIPATASRAKWQLDGRTALMKKRVVIAGLGETGLLVALGLHPDFEVIGISPKLAVVSGQELGTRIARPRDWQENYLTDFTRYRKLRGMAIRHGLITSLTPDQNQLAIQNADGTEETLTYDALVLSMGVTSGFWRSATLETREDVEPVSYTHLDVYKRQR